MILNCFPAGKDPGIAEGAIPGSILVRTRAAAYIGRMARATRPTPAATIPSISSVSKRLVWRK